MIPTTRRRWAVLALKVGIVGVVIVSVISAVLLAFLLVRHWDRPRTLVNPLSGRIRITAMVVAACVVLTCANLAALEKRRCRLIAVAGMACAFVAMVLALFENWDWWVWGWEIPAPTLAVMSSLWLWATIAAVISLLSFARLPRGVQWIRGISSFLLGCVGILLTDMVWARRTSGMPVLPEALTTIIGITAACGIVVIVLLHQIFYLKRLDAFHAGPLEVRFVCPRCGVQQDAQVGRSTCAECSLELRIELDEASCESCGYPLYKLTGQRCPECGTPFSRRGTTLPPLQR